MLVVYVEMFVFSLVFVLAQSFMINSGDYEFQFFMPSMPSILKVSSEPLVSRVSNISSLPVVFSLP